MVGLCCLHAYMYVECVAHRYWKALVVTFRGIFDGCFHVLRFKSIVVEEQQSLYQLRHLHEH